MMRDRENFLGRSVDPTSVSGSGARSARTIAKLVMLGISSRTIRLVRVPTAGVKTGIAGISDDKQHLCFALALWNGKDPILRSGSSD
jgi:hypothetical protein